MGILTDDMLRLCHEIGAWRRGRKLLLKDLGRETKAMKSATAKMQGTMRRAHAQTAKETRQERQGFVAALNTQVALMQGGFRQAHARMARESKGERLSFLFDLKSRVAKMQAGFRQVHTQMAKTVVGGLRREFAADLAGAHRAFFGLSPAELKARAEAERRREAAALVERQRLEAERRAREEKKPAQSGKGKTA